MAQERQGNGRSTRRSQEKSMGLHAGRPAGPASAEDEARLKRGQHLNAGKFVVGDRKSHYTSPAWDYLLNFAENSPSSPHCIAEPGAADRDHRGRGLMHVTFAYRERRL
jgi:hypothetical protein